MVDSSSDTLFDSLLDAYYCKLSLYEYKRPVPFVKGEYKKLKTIILPLPAELRDSTGASYSNANLELVGDIMNGSLAASSTSAFARGLPAVLQKLAPLLAGAGPGMLAPIIGDAVSGSLGNMFPPESVSTAFQQTLKGAPNPNPTVAFNGPQLREFSLSWFIQARNEKESKTARNIIQMLKAASLPESVIKDSASILRYPQLGQLNFYPWDNSGGTEWGWGNDSIIRVKKCFLSSVDVNYNPTNVPAFFEGAVESGGKQAVAIQLSINFKEVEYMLSEDWGGIKGQLTASDVNHSIVESGTALFATTGSAITNTVTAAFGASAIRPINDSDITRAIP